MPKISNEGKKSKILRLDEHTQFYLDIIMESKLFTSENEAIRAAIVDLGKRVEEGAFTKKGRQLNNNR